MTPGAAVDSLLHLIGRNLQRQQPLTAQSSVCLTLVTRRTGTRDAVWPPSFATRRRVARLLDSPYRRRLVMLGRANDGDSVPRACRDARWKALGDKRRRA